MPLIIKKLKFITSVYSFNPGVKKLQDKYAIVSEDPIDSNFTLVNFFSRESIVKKDKIVIDMKAHKISNIDIIGQPKNQYFFEKGYKYNVNEYPNAVVQTDCKLGADFLHTNHNLIHKIMELNYDSGGTLHSSNYTEIIIKLLENTT